MTEEMDRVQALQEEVNALREELAAMKAEKAAHAPVEPTASLEVIESIEKSTADQDLQVEIYCRWAAARAGAIVIAPLVGTIALMANEVYLVSRIARVYNVKLSERAVIAFLGAMGSRMAGNILTTLIPFSAVQVPVAVAITYSLGRVTQRWMKDGMPTDMGPYIDMMAEWKDRARDQVDKLKENPLKNVPLGDETADFMKRWGSTAKDTAKDTFDTVKEKSKVVVNTVRRRNTVDDLEAEQEAQAAADAVAKETEEADEAIEKAAKEATADVTADVTATPETEAPATEEPETAGEPSIAESAKAAVEDAKKSWDNK